MRTLESGKEIETVWRIGAYRGMRGVRPYEVSRHRTRETAMRKYRRVRGQKQFRFGYFIEEFAK